MPNVLFSVSSIGHFGKGGVPPPPDVNAEGVGGIKSFFCADVAHKIKIRVPNKRFPGMWDQNPRSYSYLKTPFN